MDVKKSLRVSAIVAVALALGLTMYFSLTSYAGGARHALYISTTTSVKDVGLLDVLVPKFEEYMRERGFDVDVRYVAVGTGMALRMAERGDVDLVVVHSPSLEEGYLKKGVLKCRSVFAYNYFVLVGPIGDPANASSKGIYEAFRSIALAGEKGLAVFISRGDLSGTHLKELEIWRSLGLSPDPREDRWYISAGAGMGQALLIANEELGYTLVDTGTWARFKLTGRVPNLKIVVGRDLGLLNVYSIAVVKEGSLAREFSKFLLSERGQEILAELRVGGVQLFTPISRADGDVLEYIREKGLDFGPPCS